MRASAVANRGATGGARRFRVPAARAALLGLGLFLLAGGADPATAAAQAVRGEIIDVDTGQPVPFAQVVVRNEADSVLSSVTAGASGEFVLLGLPKGALLLEVSALGYTALARTPIELQEKSLELSIELDPGPLASERIHVTVERQDPYLADRGFYTRKKRGLGHFLTPGNMSIIDASDMFRRVVAVKVQGDEPVIARGPATLRACRPGVYQDGVLVRNPFSKVPFNDVVAPPVWIQAVEVYPGPATAPPQWRDNATCGLIVVWTGG